MFSISDPVDVNSLRRVKVPDTNLTTLSFRFNINDPAFKTNTIVVNNSQTDYIAHVFVETPIYDSVSGQVIGYKASDDYVQQVSGTSNYLIRLNNTYLFLSGESLSWTYSFINNAPTVYYPVGVTAKTTCTGTGAYQHGGTVSLTPLQDGSRNVQCVVNTFP